MTIHRLSDDYPMTIRWLSDDYPTTIRRMSHDYLMTIQWLTQTLDLILSMIIDLKRSIDRRWLFKSGATFILRWSCLAIWQSDPLSFIVMYHYSFIIYSDLLIIRHQRPHPQLAILHVVASLFNTIYHHNLLFVCLLAPSGALIAIPAY